MRFTRTELESAPWHDWDRPGTWQATFVGWIGKDWQGEGCRSREVLDMLIRAVFGSLPGASVRNLERQIDACPICESTFYASRIGVILGGKADKENALARQLVVAEGVWTVLGHAELWIPLGIDRHYVSSTLIVHYTDAHGYLPPDEYITALEALQ